MAKRFERPRTEAQLNNLESRGLWKAQALAKDFAEGKEKITLEVILRIQEEIGKK